MPNNECTEKSLKTATFVFQFSDLLEYCTIFDLWIESQTSIQQANLFEKIPWSTLMCECVQNVNAAKWSEKLIKTTHTHTHTERQYCAWHKKWLNYQQFYLINQFEMALIMQLFFVRALLHQNIAASSFYNHKCTRRPQMVMQQFHADADVRYTRVTLQFYFI